MSELPVRILLIEDNPGDARLVREALSEPGTGLDATLVQFDHLRQGLDYLRTEMVDAILLDLTLPDSSGVETFEQVYAQARYAPVILLTGTDNEEVAQALMRAGAQDYLVKGSVEGKNLARSIRYAIQRKNSEDNLRASEERYRTLIEQASDGIFLTNFDGTFLEVNTSGCELCGYSRDELLNTRMFALMNGTGSHPHPGFNLDMFKDGQTIVLEFELPRKDGSKIPVELSGKMLSGGRMQSIVRDISARKQADAALRESHEFNQMLIKTLPFQMDIVDEDGHVLYIDPSLEAALGVEKAGSLPSKYRCWEVYKDDGTQCADCPLKEPIIIGRTRTLQTKGVFGGKIYEVTHTGMWYGGRKAMLEVFQDITSRKEIELQLQTTMRQLKFHVENSPLAVIGFDSEYRISNWSDRAEQIFGWSAGEVLGKKIPDFRWVYDEDVKTVDALTYSMQYEQQSSNILTNRNYRKDGSVITCEWYNSALLDEQGSLVSVQSLAMDVTEREQAIQALRESEAFANAILSNSPIGISVREPNGALLMANEAWKKIWMLTDEEVLKDSSRKRGSFVLELQNELLKPHKAAVKRLCENGGSLHLPEIRVTHPRPGAAEWVAQHFFALQDETGRIERVVVMTEDITERKKSELALIKAHSELEQKVIDSTFELRRANIELEKAARMKDQFLASMSHELRTPLTGILGLSEALQMVTYGELNEKQSKAIKNIETSGRHLLSLINDILDLSKIEAGMFEMQFATTSLEGTCQASLQMIRGVANLKHQQVSLKMEPASISLRADARRLKQMLVNLLGNAVKFTPDGGKLGIEVEGLASERQVRITVWDTGIGIQAEDMARLFQPFVQLDSSLSRQYAGTGLGLSLVKRMAEMQGGQILVESEYGSGSRFILLLPWILDEGEPVQFTRRVSDRLRRALILDSNKEGAARLTAFLTVIGLNSTVMPLLTTGVEQILQTWPDVILLNQRQGQEIGNPVILKQLKTDARTRSIPVIVICGTENREQVRQQGADGVVMEPFGKNELHAELQRVAFKGRETRSLKG